MTKRIFRSIVFVALTVLLASLGLLLGVIYSHFDRIQFDQLRVETALASHAVANEGIDYFDRLDDIMDCRITWIDSDGTVLYDSLTDSQGMENHLEREEVVSALVQGYGESVRYSDTLLEQYLYAAERLPDGTVLRLSTARQTALELLLELLIPLVLVVGLVVLLSLYLANRLSRQIVRPLNDMNLDAPMTNREYPEILPLLQRMESQQRQLRLQSRELARLQKEFSTVTRSLNEGLVLLNPMGTILSINPTAARLLEITPNCAGADFAVANPLEAITALTDKALGGEKAEQTLPLGGGSYLAVARPVRTEGILSGVVLLLLEVTQKEQAENLRREFTANVSHELKTPLHAISGYAELLKSGMVSPSDVPAFGGKIYTEARRLVQLVEDILRLSRMDEGPGELTWSEVDLYAVAAETLENQRSSAELAGVTMVLQGKARPIRAVPQLCAAVVFNLVDNAVKYNHPGGRVTVSVEELPNAVRLQVSDTGIGIPAAHRERIFERFYRVDKSHSKAVGGTGLGLSIVKHAAQILNAELTLRSAENQGTTVTVDFPRT